MAHEVGGVKARRKSGIEAIRPPASRSAAGFSKAQLEALHGTLVPDLLGSDLRLLFVAISPGLWSAAVQAHFAHPGNRFWPALWAGRVIDRRIRPHAGICPQDRDYLLDHGLGITSLVPWATAQPHELTSADLRAGRRRLKDVVDRHRPEVVAICGLRAFQIAFGRRDHVVPGCQPERFAGSQLWVVPNPTAANRQVSLTEIATAYRRAAIAAGVVTTAGC